MVQIPFFLGLSHHLQPDILKVEILIGWMVGNLILACLYLCTVEPRYNEPLDNEVLGTTNDFLYLRSGKNIFTKSRNSKPIFSSPLTRRYFEVPLYSRTPHSSDKNWGERAAVHRLQSQASIRFLLRSPRP